MCLLPKSIFKIISHKSALDVDALTVQRWSSACVKCVSCACQTPPNLPFHMLPTPTRKENNRKSPLAAGWLSNKLGFKRSAKCSWGRILLWVSPLSTSSSSFFLSTTNLTPSCHPIYISWKTIVCFKSRCLDVDQMISTLFKPNSHTQAMEKGGAALIWFFQKEIRKWSIWKSGFMCKMISDD